MIPSWQCYAHVMRICRHHFLLWSLFLLSWSSDGLAQPLVVVPGRANDVNSKVNSKNYESLKGELKNYQEEAPTSKIKTSETLVKPLQHQGLYTGIAYTLISPSFDSENLKNLNQESLGLTVTTGYLYSPAKGWGIGLGMGVFQNSKTDRSLPDFVAFKPNIYLIYNLDSRFYLSSGIYTLKWQDEKFKNFVSYIGSDYQLGYKVNQKMSLKFGFTFIKILGEFADSNNKQTPSLVSIRGIESQLLYLF